MLLSSVAFAYLRLARESSFRCLKTVLDRDTRPNHLLYAKRRTIGRKWCVPSVRTQQKKKTGLFKRLKSAQMSATRLTEVLTPLQISEDLTQCEDILELKFKNTSFFIETDVPSLYCKPFTDPNPWKVPESIFGRARSNSNMSDFMTLAGQMSRSAQRAKWVCSFVVWSSY